jgi:hypothetical protein
VRVATISAINHTQSANPSTSASFAPRSRCFYDWRSAERVANFGEKPIIVCMQHQDQLPVKLSAIHSVIFPEQRGSGRPSGLGVPSGGVTTPSFETVSVIYHSASINDI